MNKAVHVLPRLKAQTLDTKITFNDSSPELNSTQGGPLADTGVSLLRLAVLLESLGHAPRDWRVS